MSLGNSWVSYYHDGTRWYRLTDVGSYPCDPPNMTSPQTPIQYLTPTPQPLFCPAPSRPYAKKKVTHGR